MNPFSKRALVTITILVMLAFIFGEPLKNTSLSVQAAPLDQGPPPDPKDPPPDPLLYITHK